MQLHINVYVRQNTCVHALMALTARADILRSPWPEEPVLHQINRRRHASVCAHCGVEATKTELNMQNFLPAS